MRCPFCGHTETRGIDSRLLGEGDQVRRRRECLSCKARFTTYETAELSLPRVVKSDGRRETFNDEKLRGGIVKALEKRPVPMSRVESTINQIKRRVRETGDREISALKIGDIVMDELRSLDQVAYVRFASVYRSFEDVRAFLEEIENLENELPPHMREQQLDLLKPARSGGARDRKRGKSGAEETGGAQDDASGD